HRILAIERLNGRLLVDAEHRRVLRRIEIQPDDVSGFRLELRIVGGDVALAPMRLQTMLGPDARNRHVRDATAQLSSQFTGRPMRRTIGGFALRRPRQYSRFQPITDLVSLAPRMTTEQSRQPLGLEPFTPPMDIAVAAVELDADISPCRTVVQQ